MFEKFLDNTTLQRCLECGTLLIFSRFSQIDPKSKLLSPVEYFDCQKIMLWMQKVINL